MGATTRQLLKDRWDTLMMDTARLDDEMGIVNSERWQRIDETLDELATLLVREVHDDDRDGLMTVTMGIWDEIESRLLAWAETIVGQREEDRVAA